ncbi:MAG: hypothetical protein COB38_13390 [Gammaproteobacteria bacterium]|nr:MAG: hypothetical protein COB38_13390 [Gammaproteobacteria bacterium]
MTEEHQTEDVYHLSNLPKNQLWFWIGQNLEPDTPFFNMPMALTIQGEVDPVRFAHAFQQVVNKADALRTIIKLNNGVPQRVVLDKLDYQVEFLDFSNNLDPQKAFDEWATPRCKEIFDLEKRLFDSVLVKLGDNQVMWYWCQHHLICDGWSTALVYRYVSEFYEKSFNEDIEELPDFPSFEGYVDREQEYRESKAHQQSKAHWEKVLSEPLDTLNFYGRTSRDHGVNKAIRMTRDLGVDRTNAIKALCKQKPFKSLSPHLSTFQLISTCLLAYLYRITGNEDLALGTLYHNRATPDDKNTVGFFMETAPLRVSATAEDTFESLYKKTKRTSMEVMRHYRYAPGNPMNNRAYDVAINYNNASYPPFAGMPMSLHWLHTGAWYSHEPLAIQIHDFDGTGTLTIAFDFNVGVFDEETRERAIEHFFKCIDAFIDNPTGSITDFNILTDKENQLINGPFRAQKGFEIPDVCLHQLFEQQAKLTPDNIAVYNQDVSYSYKELLERVEKLSAYLKLKGVQIDAPVGLSMSKHPDMIVAMLAILKAGGGYVPLDPAYPNERLDYMIKDSGIQFLLTQKKLLDNLPAHQCSIILLDSDWSEINNTDLDSSQLSECPDPKPNNLAYVIYTSGSTGDAKGVMIEHQSIVNYTIAAKEAFGFCEQDKMLQFASISFDTAGEEIYPTLISGGTLCLADDSMLGSAKEFLKACEREKITFLDLPTAFWHQITASIIEDKLTLPSSIRNVIIGGERAQPQAVANWIESVKTTQTEGSDKIEAKLINTYGPTECTIVSSYCDLNADNTNREQEAPIGLPVKNLYAYVLDKNMQPVALGVTGELHMGGVGLARGYLGKPEMTEEKFIADPFSNNSASKLYKTGDLVRFREDGLLEYRDRADDQVKIRGFRIEVGEVESALLKIEEIEQGIINVHEDENKNKQLIAYYVPFTDTNLNASLIRSSLKQSLPDYMLPQHYIQLDEIPMTANGKINRKALPEPNMEDNDNERDVIPLETNAQNKIAKIWLTLPNINQVGLYDNFFDIGGDSLLMMQVISGLERELQFKSNPRMLVSLNLAQLASELESQHPQLKSEKIKPSEKKQIASNDGDKATPFFIRSLNKHLFAYYHKPTSHAPTGHAPSKQSSKKEQAILLCYPTGQEYLRIFRCFKLLTKRLTDLGFHVLRFDYFGTGDSDGNAIDCNMDIWTHNINDAIEQLKSKSGLNEVSILGLRLGANLANKAAANRTDIGTIINWDPIIDGESNLASLKTMHREMLVDKDRFYIKRDSNECDKSELIGFNYSEQLLQELQNIKSTDWSKEMQSKHHVIFSNNKQQHNNSASDKFNNSDTFDTSLSWTDTEQIETSVAPQTIISHICKELLK